MNNQHPLPIFVSYAHEDNENEDKKLRWLDRLLQELKLLTDQNLVSVWSDKNLKIGVHWQEDLQTALEQAKVIVLLVSTNFLTSDFIRNDEMPIILKNATDRKIDILPIIIRPVIWKFASFDYQDSDNEIKKFKLSTLQAANSPDNPLIEMSQADQDRVLQKIAKRIIEIVETNEK